MLRRRVAHRRVLQCLGRIVDSLPVGPLAFVSLPATGVALLLCLPGMAQETLYAVIDMEDVFRTRRAIPTSVQRRLDLYSLKTVGGNRGDGSPAASV